MSEVFASIFRFYTDTKSSCLCSLVMIDLKKYDFTAEQIATLLSTKSGSYQSKAPVIAVNGKNMTMARYPNDEWIAMEHGQFYDSHGNPTQYTDNDRSIPKDLQASTTIVEYGDEHFETVTSWPATFFIDFICALPPTRDTEIPTFIAGRKP